MKNRENCPFCALADGRVFLESRLAVSTWDGFPVSPGHALVLPRRHVADWSDTTPEERLEVMKLIDRTRTMIEQDHSPDGYNIGMNIGHAAGQTVFHTHIHVIPRYLGDVPNPKGGLRRILPNRPRCKKHG